MVIGSIFGSSKIEMAGHNLFDLPKNIKMPGHNFSSPEYCTYNTCTLLYCKVTIGFYWEDFGKILKKYIMLQHTRDVPDTTLPDNRI